MISAISVQFSALWHMLYPLLGLTESFSVQVQPSPYQGPVGNLHVDFWNLTLFASLLSYSNPWILTSLHPWILNSTPSSATPLSSAWTLLPSPREKKNPRVTWGSPHVFPFSQDHSPILPVSKWLKTIASRFCWVLLLFMVGGHVHISHCHGRKPIGTFSSIHNKSWKLTIY